MPRKLAQDAPVTVIKWTEEEWGLIASRLLELKGRALQASPELDEVKARDIFVAQEVLPEDRHRKLISISQGVQASRQHIQKILQKKHGGAQPDLLDHARPEETGGQAQTDSKSQAGHSNEHPKAGKRQSKAETAAGAAEKQTLAAAEAAGTPEENAGDITDELAGSDKPEPVDASSTATAPSDSLPQAAVAQPSSSSVATSATSAQPSSGQQHPPRHAAVPTHSPAGPGNANRNQGMAGQKGASPDRKQFNQQAAVAATDAAMQNAAGLVELARPFVAMVCQELAAALVNEFTKKDNSHLLAAFVKGAASGSRPGNGGAANGSAGSGSPGSMQEQRARGREQAAYVQKVEAEPAYQGDEQPPAAMHQEEDDSHLSENDVQPLFDPKLPPSANSAFKPMIALIGSNTRDFEDLQRLYPQFELKVVGLENLRTEPSLRNCQRMVGLRESIPAPADEFLRKTFRHRYVRVLGGLAQLRAQLNTWLDNPVSMNTGPAWPRKQPNNDKGQAPGHSKKRQFRRPKPNQ
jgi:hypothetical protein